RFRGSPRSPRRSPPLAGVSQGGISPRTTRWRRGADSPSRGLPTGKLDDEGRAFPGLALEGNRSAVCLDDLTRDPEPEPEPTVVPVRNRALEALEDAPLLLERDPDPVIPNHQARAAVRGEHADLDRLARAVLEGVAEQVRDHLVHPHRVPKAADGLRRLDRDRAVGRRDLRREALHHRRYQRHEIHRLPLEREAAGLNAGHRQGLRDQGIEPSDVVLHLSESPEDQLALSIALHETGEALYLELEGGERRPQLVPGNGKEVVPELDGLGLRALRLLLHVDVRPGADPFGDGPRVIAHGDAAADHPAIAPVLGSAQAALKLAVAPGVDGALPRGEDGADILRVNGLHPAGAETLVRAETRVGVPALVEVIHAAVGVARPNEVRDRLGERPKPAFALDELLEVLRGRDGEPRPIGDVLEQHAVVVRERGLLLVPGERQHAVDSAPSANRDAEERPNGELCE